jgi:hypothetical protein
MVKPQRWLCWPRWHRHNDDELNGCGGGYRSYLTDIVLQDLKALEVSKVDMSACCNPYVTGNIQRILHNQVSFACHCLCDVEPYRGVNHTFLWSIYF